MATGTAAEYDDVAVCTAGDYLCDGEKMMATGAVTYGYGL